MPHAFSSAAFLYGVVGDASLQLIDKCSDKGREWGLHSYFEQHGPIASLFIAGAMTSGTLYVHDLLFRERSILTLFGLGMALDVLFRTQMPMDSLKDYYNKLTPPYTLFWAGFPSALMVGM